MENTTAPNAGRSDGKFSLRPATDLSAIYLSYTLPTGGGTQVLPESVIGAAKSHGVTVELDVEAIKKPSLKAAPMFAWATDVLLCQESTGTSRYCSTI